VLYGVSGFVVEIVYLVSVGAETVCGLRLANVDGEENAILLIGVHGCDFSPCLASSGARATFPLIVWARCWVDG
jgi:hypothetical protein